MGLIRVSGVSMRVEHGEPGKIIINDSQTGKGGKGGKELVLVRLSNKVVM